MLTYNDNIHGFTLETVAVNSKHLLLECQNQSRTAPTCLSTESANFVILDLEGFRIKSSQADLKMIGYVGFNYLVAETNAIVVFEFASLPGRRFAANLYDCVLYELNPDHGFRRLHDLAGALIDGERRFKTVATTAQKKLISALLMGSVTPDELVKDSSIPGNHLKELEHFYTGGWRLKVKGVHITDLVVEAGE